MSGKTTIFIILLLSISVSGPLLVSGQAPDEQKAGWGEYEESRLMGLVITNPIGNRTVCQIIKTTIGWLIGAGGLITAGVVVYAGFQMLTSAGDPKKAQDAKSTILYAVVGYAILLLSWGIVSIVQQILGANVLTC